MSPAPWEYDPRQKPWRSRAEASCAEFRSLLRRQCSASFGLSKSLSKGRTMVFPSPSPVSSSLKTGSETTYFSLAQLPRSRSRQRLLQNGKSAWAAESVSALQMGHLCFIARFFSALRTLRSLCAQCRKILRGGHRDCRGKDNLNLRK